MKFGFLRLFVFSTKYAILLRMYVVIICCLNKNRLELAYSMVLYTHVFCFVVWNESLRWNIVKIWISPWAKRKCHSYNENIDRARAFGTSFYGCLSVCGGEIGEMWSENRWSLELQYKRFLLCQYFCKIIHVLSVCELFDVVGGSDW